MSDEERPAHVEAPAPDDSSEGLRADLQRRCDAIESGYEFMLAYAAQGVSGDAASQSGGQLRTLLTQAADALDGLAKQYLALVEREVLLPFGPYRDFLAVLDRDAAAALAAMRLVLAQRSISSQVVDNLNASIHVRALLTDLFLVDEIIELQATPAAASPSNPTTSPE